MTGNAEAIDLICRRYSVGSPSEYLRRTKTVADVALDYAIARRYRDSEASGVLRSLADDLRKLPNDADPGSAVLVALQWLILVTSSK
jgi:hypothetical protein